MADVQTRSTTLSLIISSLDESAKLNRTLGSVFTGSVVPAETIILDDESTDGSCAAQERYNWRAEGVKVNQIERSGIAAARSIGRRPASGAHLIFVDTHCLAELHAAVIARSNAILAPAICDFGAHWGRTQRRSLTASQVMSPAASGKERPTMRSPEKPLPRCTCC